MEWKFVDEADGAFRVEPYGYGLMASTAGVVVFGVIAGLWYIRTVPIDIKIAMSAIGGVAGIGIVGFLIWMKHHQAQLGAYHTANRDEIRLRHDVRIPLADFDKMSITRRWEVTGLGVVQMSYLVLTFKSGKEFEILGSMYNREIVRLKQKIEEGMHGLLPSA